MITILLSLNYLFYTVCASLILWTYYLVKDGEGSTPGGYFLSTFVLAWSLYYFDGFRAIAFSWPNGLYLVAAYLCAGLVVMAIKWVITLRGFKARAALWLKDHPDKVESHYGTKVDDLSRHLYGSLYHNRVVVDKATREHPRVEGSTLTEEVYRLNHHAFPLSNWCVFWPLFTLSIVLDEAVNGVKRTINRLSGVLDSISKAFSVKT